ncbi:PQQ-binding-like beta-propeller repeat protein [Cellulomonas sp. HZM]|uniref:outer membrane protein assembly factor BamB family protein n=1 Tax=Cellulomonas sp. HZM TaxID=1454010 RepID=UPI00049361B4|nr:PQQ-binding-like beta-propeller repeat protein [Cellulomonas sp. HZM]
MDARGASHRPSMTVVDLEESPGARASRRTGERAWPTDAPLARFVHLHRRRFAAVAALVALVVGGVLVVGPRVTAGAERRDVLAAAAFASGVRSLAHPLRERWRADVGDAFDPVLVGATLVVPDPDDGRGVVGLDVVTGERLWGRALDAFGPVQGCVEVAARVACLAGLDGRADLPPAVLSVLDAGDGELVATHELVGRWSAIASADEDVVLAGWLPVGLRVERLDPISAAPRWTSPSRTTDNPRAQGGVSLDVGAGVVVATSSPERLLLDARTGESRVADDDDEIRVRPDGTVLRTRTSPTRRGYAISTTVMWPTGSTPATTTALGRAALVAVDDRARPGVVTLEPRRRGLVVRQYAPGSNDPTWSSDEVGGSVVANLRDRVVLRRASALVALDAASGQRVWQRPSDDADGAVLSDGSRLAVVGAQRTLVVLRLDDGSDAWSQELPAGTDAVVTIGSQAYATGRGVLVALR